MRCFFYLSVLAILALNLQHPKAARADENPSSSNEKLVAQVADLLGRAAGCKAIAQSRIDAMTSKMMKAVAKMAPNRNEFAILVQTFDAKESEGRSASPNRKIDCKVTETQLADLEAAVAFAPGQTSDGNSPAALQSRGLAPAPQPVSNERAIRGVSDTEIRIGSIVPLTGPNKEAGYQTEVGIRAAFNAVNAEGGVNGRQLELVVADDAYDSTKTPEALNSLYNDRRVFALLGCYGTAGATVSVPFVLEHRMIFFAPITGAGVVRRDPPDRYVFNYRASIAEETEAAVRFLVKIRHLKTEQVAVFAQQDGYGDSGFAGVEKAVRNLSGGVNKPILRLNYKRNTIDVEEALSQLKKMPPGGIKAIVMVATYRAAARFVEKTRETMPGLLYVHNAGVGASRLAGELALLGARYLVDNIVTQGVPAADGYASIALRYRAMLAKYYPTEIPDAVSFESFIASQIFIEALRRCDKEINTERVVDALESIRDFDLGLGAKISFGPSEHQALHKVWGTQLTESGKYVPIDLQ